MNNTHAPGYVESGLQFFGQMTASVTHEVKNCLSIMNENAGLLQDLVVLLNRQGKPLDPERVDRIAGQVVGQVQRADDIIKNLNRFAHSVDEPNRQVDWGELLSLSLTLAQRSATNRGVALNFSLPGETITAVTHPFFLMQAVWNCLDFAMDMSDNDKEITILLQQENGSIKIAFQGFAALKDQDRADDFRAKMDAIIARLDGQLRINEDRAGVCLVFGGRQVA